MTTPDAPDLSAERLTLLYHLSQTFNSTLDLDEVLSKVMDETIAALNAERGFVMLQESDGGLTFRAARGIDRKTVEDPEFQISRGVVDQVAQEGVGIVTSDASRDARFNQRASVMHLQLRSILCAPLKLKGRLLGVVYVDNRLQAGIFDREDLDLLEAIAASAAVAIENARLYEVAVEQGRIERELQMARRVQSGLMPDSMPSAAGWAFAARWRPARVVAGDFYDAIHHGEDQVGFLIADVTDKGMPAALFMAHARTILRASLEPDASPADAIARANRLICAESTSAMPVSLFYARLHPSGSLTYVNAGHNPPFVQRRDSADLESLPPTGILLGVDPNAAFEQQDLQLTTGDRLLLYTDGVTDAVNASGEQFGLDRLQAVLNRHPAASETAVADALLAELEAFVGDAEPYDDVTFIVAVRT